MELIYHHFSKDSNLKNIAIKFYVAYEGIGHAEGKEAECMQEVTSDGKDWTGKRSEFNLKTTQRQVQDTSGASLGMWEELQKDICISPEGNDFMEQPESVSLECAKLSRDDEKKDLRIETEIRCDSQFDSSDKKHNKENQAIIDHKKSGEITTTNYSPIEPNTMHELLFKEGGNWSEAIQQQSTDERGRIRDELNERNSQVYLNQESQAKQNDRSSSDQTIEVKMFDICIETVSEQENDEDSSMEQVGEEEKNGGYSEQVVEQYENTGIRNRSE